QNFAKAFDVTFVTKENKQELVWATSWGVSTRLMGALVMAHSDDNGLVLPPKLAPIQVVIVPIFRKEEELAAISEKVGTLIEKLKGKGISVKFDDRDTHKPGFKFAEWELKGVPVRLAIGPRDLANGTVEVARRDTMEKDILQMEGIDDKIENLLVQIQKNIFQKAFDFRANNTFNVDTWEEFKAQIEKGGFIYAHWDGTAETEQKIKEETKATIRSIPIDGKMEEGKCIYTGNPSKQRVVFARAY
ncbi:MAG: proline--tRNA ligase, partial [Chlorobi bacterium]|nr:proline--tRNA ligase [Chlorobiota bacterium]